jgi:hypothetical protein
MFVTAALERKIVISYLAAFIFYLRTRFLMASFNGLLIIKPKSQENFRAAAMLFTSLLK